MNINRVLISMIAAFCASTYGGNREEGGWVMLDFLKLTPVENEPATLTAKNLDDPVTSDPSDLYKKVFEELEDVRGLALRTAKEISSHPSAKGGKCPHLTALVFEAGIEDVGAAVANARRRLEAEMQRIKEEAATDELPKKEALPGENSAQSGENGKQEVNSALPPQVQPAAVLPPQVQPAVAVNSVLPPQVQPTFPFVR